MFYFDISLELTIEIIKFSNLKLPDVSFAGLWVATLNFKRQNSRFFRLHVIQRFNFNKIPEPINPHVDALSKQKQMPPGNIIKHDSFNQIKFDDSVNPKCHSNGMKRNFNGKIPIKVVQSKSKSKKKITRVKELFQ